MGGTLLVGGTTLLLDGGVTLLEEDGVLERVLSSSVDAVWQAVSTSNSKTTISRADKKRYFFIGSQPFSKIRKIFSPFSIL